MFCVKEGRSRKLSHLWRATRCAGPTAKAVHAAAGVCAAPPPSPPLLLLAATLRRLGARWTNDLARTTMML